MSLIKHLPWFLAGIPVAALIGYSFWPEPEPKAVSVAAQPISVSKQGNPTPPKRAADGSRIKELSPEEIAARKRYNEAKAKADASRKRADASFKKLAENFTPEYCTRMADGIMKRRDAGYQKHFDSWNLDDRTAQQALEIMREREIRRLQNQGKYFRNAYASASVKQKTISDQTEDSVSQEELSLLLGAARGTELLNAAIQTDKDELASALQLLRERQKVGRNE